MIVPLLMRVYQYSKCGTCRKATKWLQQAQIDFDSIDIVTAPPSKRQLKEVLTLSGLPLKKLFNTSGQSYRQGGFKEKLASMSESEALDALAQDGKLIKRPIVLGKDIALVGFKQAEYEEYFG